MTRKSAIVIFPGRGTYGKSELAYLSRFHSDKQAFIAGVDDWRAQHGRATVSDLDNAGSYAASKHASSVNASAIIYTCALADFQSINADKIDIVGVCGNSLGWYLTLAAAGGVALQDGIRVVDTMGALMEEKGVGGQLVYPFVDEDWRPSKERERAIGEALHAGRTAGNAYLSIRLGGTAVLAGDDAGMAAMEQSLPVVEERFPFRLARHSAFHTPLLEHVSHAAFEALPSDLFRAPSIPMIDGRGAIWTPGATSTDALYKYTLGHQIYETFDFSKSVEVAIKEFAPDCLILAGPGATLGAAIAQELIRHRWNGLTSKADFSAMQKDDPFLLAMGREDQRGGVI